MRFNVRKDLSPLWKLSLLSSSKITKNSIKIASKMLYKNLILKSRLSWPLSTLAQGTVPDHWRQVNEAPVFKKGEKYDAANCRLVSLTFICCKTLEHITVSNTNKHLEFESFLANCPRCFFSISEV